MTIQTKISKEEVQVISGSMVRVEQFVLSVKGDGDTEFYQLIQAPSERELVKMVVEFGLDKVIKEAA